MLNESPARSTEVHGSDLRWLGRTAGAFPLLATGQTNSAAVAQDGSDANSVLAQTGEKLALEILQTTAMKEAIAKAAARLRDERYGQQTGWPALREVGGGRSRDGCGGLCGNGESAGSRVPLDCGESTKVEWHTFPGTRWFADNNDTLYRATRIDDKSHL